MLRKIPYSTTIPIITITIIAAKTPAMSVLVPVSYTHLMLHPQLHPSFQPHENEFQKHPHRELYSQPEL